MMIFYHIDKEDADHLPDILSPLIIRKLPIGSFSLFQYAVDRSFQDADHRIGTRTHRIDADHILLI